MSLIKISKREKVTAWPPGWAWLCLRVAHVGVLSHVGWVMRLALGTGCLPSTSWALTAWPQLWVVFLMGKLRYHVEGTWLILWLTPRPWVLWFPVEVQRALPSHCLGYQRLPSADISLVTILVGRVCTKSTARNLAKSGETMSFKEKCQISQY